MLINFAFSMKYILINRPNNASFNRNYITSHLNTIFKQIFHRIRYQSQVKMYRSPSQPVFLDHDRGSRQQSHLAKSNFMKDILTGGLTPQQSNGHFIDALERFKKDFATYDKQERQRQRQKRFKILEERKNQQIERQSRMRRNQVQYDQQHLHRDNQSRYLCEVGLKKNGYSNGMPINPITLQYHQNPFGNQQKFIDEQQKLKRLVRAHHIQNASTSGYNLINGQNLPSIDPLVPKNHQGRLEKKLGQFYRQKRLDPNIDLQLNPKNMLPRYVGEVDHYNQSLMKGQMWDENGNDFQTSYQRHFNRQANQVLTNSRMEQDDYYPHMAPLQHNHLMRQQQNSMLQQQNPSHMMERQNNMEQQHPSHMMERQQQQQQQQTTMIEQQPLNHNNYNQHGYNHAIGQQSPNHRPHTDNNYNPYAQEEQYRNQYMRR